MMTAKLMIEAIFQWWIAIMVIVGIGRAIESGFSTKNSGKLQMITVWFGLTGFVCIVYSFNLFSGLVGWQMKVVILLFAPLGMWETVKFLSPIKILKERLNFADLFIGLGAVVTIVVLANWSIGSAQAGDSSLYHIGLVDYAAKYPVIPGLANLHSRFGFSSTTYLLSAVFQNGVWGAEGFRLVNGFICVLVLFEVVYRVRKIVSLGCGDLSDYILIIGLNIVVYSAIWIPSTSISSPSPDLPAALLLLIAIVYASKAFCINDQIQYEHAFCLAILSFSFRPVTAPLAIFLLALMIYQKLIQKTIEKLTIVIFSLTSILLLMIVARNIVITGYLFYPSSLRISSLDWAVPKSSAEIDLNAIEAWAKTPAVPYEQVLQSNSWVVGWINRWKQHFLLPSISILLGCLVLAAAIRNNFKGLIRITPVKLFAAMIMLIIFWGYSAPDPRFAVGIIAALVALPASWGLALVGSRRILKFTAAQLALFLIVGAQLLYIASTPTYPYSTLFRKASALFDSGFVPFMGEPTRSVVLKSGLVVQVPTDDEGCFRVEMCTVGVNSMTEGLELRRTKISDGFRIED